MAKKKLRFRPTWSPEIEGYTYNACRRYWPSLAPWYEWDDLMQEARVIFLLCARRYGTTVDNRKWFMALFKTAWQRRLSDLANSIPKYSLFEGVDDELMHPMIESTTALADLAVAIEKLPLGLKLVLSDLCRPKQRLKPSKRTLANLRAALG